MFFHDLIPRQLIIPVSNSQHKHEPISLAFVVRFDLFFESNILRVVQLLQLFHSFLLLFVFLVDDLLLFIVFDQFWRKMELWLPGIGTARPSQPLYSEEVCPILYLLSDYSLDRVLTHTNKGYKYYQAHLPLFIYPQLVYWKVICINGIQQQFCMDEVQQFDDCFQVELNIAKVTQIIFLSENTLLVCHLPNSYTIVEIKSRSDIKILKTGMFPPLVEQIKSFKAYWVFFIEGNNLHLFDLMTSQSLCAYSIPKSDIYQEKFKYQYVEDQSLAIFYKISILKSTPLTVYYDIHQLSVSDKLERVKKSKVEYQQLRKLGYCQGEVVSYQTTGYQIEIIFLESGIMHRINSIFNLYLVESIENKHSISLNFTHETLQNELVTYEVTKKKVRKTQRKQIKLNPHVYYNHNQTRSFVYKNYFNHRKADHFTGIFRVKFEKSSKYLGILQHLLPEGVGVGVEFRQTVLDLLT